ncbi:MAG: hypothetical protein ACWA6X_00970 [Bauldia sp.]
MLLASAALLPEAHAAPGLLARPGARYSVYDEALSQVLPDDGFQSRIALGDSIPKLVEAGVIDAERYLALYSIDGPAPADLAQVLTKPADVPMGLTRANAPYLVNLLWPVGLSTFMRGNFSSPLNGQARDSFASTRGWTLGRNINGGTYFNRFPIVDLDFEQEALVVKVAQATYRPCCDNSTFFQDCNHGSALLGLLQLGSSQGLTEDELFSEALAFNSFWFPDNYVMTALYFEVFEKTNWADVDPRQVMAANFSSGSGWESNVARPLSTVPDLLPPAGGAINCGW